MSHSNKPQPNNVEWVSDSGPEAFLLPHGLDPDKFENDAGSDVGLREPDDFDYKCFKDRGLKPADLWGAEVQAGYRRYLRKTK